MCTCARREHAHPHTHSHTWQHPDQAAGCLVDVALALGKPFACVPCCVYTKTFPKRHLPDGQQVCTYEQLVEWLVLKAPNQIKVHKLDFEGRNLVVYSTGTDN